MHQALAPYRLGPQLLVGDAAPTATDVVRHFGAVQAQEHTTAPWSVGRRCAAPAVDVVTDDLRRGGVVRTHVLRPTWHWVHADDLPLLIAATSDRVRHLAVGHLARLDVPEHLAEAASGVVADAVRASPGCTRDDVAARLDEAGFEITGDVLAHVVELAELRGDVAGHRSPGEPHRYVPLDLRPYHGSVEEARAELARVYARGHGPVSAHDLAWWTSLTLTQARRAIADAGLAPVVLAGRELWAIDDQATLAEHTVEVPDVLLLANLDELISYRRDDALKAEIGPLHAQLIWGFGLLALDGRFCGHWTRTVRSGTVQIDVVTDARPARRHRAALDAEAARFGTFWGLDAAVTITPA